MSNEVKKYIERLKEVKEELLEKFSTKEEAIEYFMKETNLSKEECSNAYDILIKIDFSKNFDQ